MNPPTYPAPLPPPDPLAYELVAGLIEAVAEQAARLPAARAFDATPLRARLLGRVVHSASAGRRLFTVGAVVNGELITQGRAYNKKDASQIAAQLAMEKLGLNKIEGEENL